MAEQTQSGSLRRILCADARPRPCGVVIFGASGDLTRRKLLPALFALYRRRLMPENFFILGCARTELTDDTFRDHVRDSLKANAADAEDSDVRDFVRRCGYLAGEYRDAAHYASLAVRLATLEREHGTGGSCIFYLSTPPVLYAPVVERLGAAGLAGEAGGAWRRVVMEKPFGRDLESAVALQDSVQRILAEHQIYRIDHYLGKETVQNILMFRFANIVFEPVWNLRYVDHVQITTAESIGVGHRAGYFERAGLLRDMFQNHMLQMLALVAMEPPVSFHADDVRDEKVKLLRSLRPFDAATLPDLVVRGQYDAGRIAGGDVRAYRGEEGVAPDSAVETFAAMKLFIDNWRWRGVPFYLRSGKRLPRKVSEIAIVFKGVPHSIFTPLLPGDLAPNVLVLNVQPEEGFALTIQAKRPGAKLCMGDLAMDFNYRDVFGGDPPDAYERLLLDSMLGDQTLFIREDVVAEGWEFFAPVLEACAKGADDTAFPLHAYKAGSWGPDAANALVARDGHMWRIP